MAFEIHSEAPGSLVLRKILGDEVPHEAEALTLSASLFPDQGRENRFFVEAPRKIFAHLLNLKPTPEELTYWMCHAEEIDKRVEGTEMEAMIDRSAAAQRSGVLGSLNMVADAFKLLPKEIETHRRWSTVEWAKQRKGWIFLTSKPTMRERMRPLMSLWLDLLVLRMMNDESEVRRKTWFVLDELASLQHLPQLTTAVTENRKSNNPMVLGFQGKAQVEALYGHVSEAMLSQPATKLRRLIQNGLLPHLHDGEGSPFLLDIRDLDAYVEKHKHHGTDDPIFRPLPVHEPSTSSKLKGDDYAASSGNRKPVSAERQRGLVDQIPSQRKIVS